ncbi:PAS domain-containing protein [Falsirhodobacter halotolerans]|uniref:PAS domain-containing protein n=1 Tax=Falsirhodobacter halotolerans TaxID=1146892 RepID=UPI001FD07A3D|nr:PAS domain-containing protein [Falsirhodobacter halotolerans]
MNERDDWHLTDLLRYERGRGDPFAAAVRATRMPMLVTDPHQSDNPIVFVNEAFQTLTGYSRDECVGRNCRFLQGERTDPHAVGVLREAVRNGKDATVDILNYRKDGTSFWNALYISPVRNDDGEVAFFFASQLDISDRVAERQDIERQRNVIADEVEMRTSELKDALAAKTRLLDELDHRVKNNLAMIGSFLRLQARAVNDPKVRRMAEATMMRVDTLSAVHRHIYLDGQLLPLDVADFAQTLLTDFTRQKGQGRVRIRTEIEPSPVRAPVASTIGIVMGEIVDGMISHTAATGGDVALHVKSTIGASVITLSTTAADFTLSSVDPDGLRGTLIARLSRSLDLTIVETRDDHRATVIITIPARRMTN